jgi:hypothetical protein
VPGVQRALQEYVIVSYKGHVARGRGSRSKFDTKPTQESIGRDHTPVVQGDGEERDGKTRKNMARTKNLFITIMQNQSRVEYAEWELHHHCLQVRLSQHEQKVARGTGHVDKSLGPRHL